MKTLIADCLSFLLAFTLSAAAAGPCSSCQAPSATPAAYELHAKAEG
jgi:hypothetical protein